MLDRLIAAAQCRSMSGPATTDSPSEASLKQLTKKGVYSLSASPEEARIPVVFASPHSGRNYTPDLCQRTSIALSQLRRSEDAFVDELIEAAPASGGLRLCALFPRVFVDVNRSALELDPVMFADRLPDGSYAQTRRTASGLGVLPRISADGRALYRGKLRYAEARHRLDTYYHPYHNMLLCCVEVLRRRFGLALVLDIHSMPHHSARGADIVLGDRYGQSCHPGLTAFADAHFQEAGFVTVRNTPYAGGHTTEHYGKPETGVHVLQIEINRSLYMDENRIVAASGFQAMREKMRSFFNAVANVDWAVTLTS